LSEWYRGLVFLCYKLLRWRKNSVYIDLFMHYTKRAYGRFPQIFYYRGIMLTTSLLSAQQTLVMVTHISFFFFLTVSSFYIKIHPKVWWQWRDTEGTLATDFLRLLAFIKTQKQNKWGNIRGKENFWCVISVVWYSCVHTWLVWFDTRVSVHG
jgi:hypothetical protein